MLAALKLNWYKFTHAILDFVKVLVGLIVFEFLIIYIQRDGFMSNFETTRMTLFLLLFSSSLLILVQNSIYISKERAILERDFFSGLSPVAYALSSLLFNIAFTVVEVVVFLAGYFALTGFFDIELPDKGVMTSFTVEFFITVFLVFLSAHVLALLLSALAGSSEITSVILAVMVGIGQFSLSGTILQLPEKIEFLTKGIFLGYGHKLAGMTHDIEHLESALAEFQVPIKPEELEQFEASTSVVVQDWEILALHILIYSVLFTLVLRKKV